jgi:hypothetical protein
MRLRPKKPQSKLELAIHWRQWKRLEAFPGVTNWRQIGSEVEMMQSLNPASRRERIRNSQKTIFRLRLRDAWSGSIVFQ